MAWHPQPYLKGYTNNLFIAIIIVVNGKVSVEKFLEYPFLNIILC